MKPGARLRVLVVDDTAVVRAVIERVLVRAGHEILSAGSGEEALAILGRTTPDAVLLDLQMPGMTGTTTYHAMVSRWPYLQGRIAVMSGDLESYEVTAWLNATGAPTLDKPFEIRQVLDLLQTLSRGRAAANDGP